MRIRVVLNVGTNETHGMGHGKMGEEDPNEKECLLLSSLCSALRLYHITEILPSTHGGHCGLLLTVFIKLI